MNTRKRVLAFLSATITLMSFNSVAADTFANEKEIIFKNGKHSVVSYEGTIEVLENRNDKNSRKIPLSYIRFPFTGNKKGSPIVYLSGGPGGSGISAARREDFRFPLFMALREFGDVIALDQRGTGKSRIVPRCESKQSLPLNERLSEIQVTEIYRAAVYECVEFWENEGADVLGYTTLQNAHDLNDLRKHLQAENLLYGSFLTVLI